MSRSLVGSSSSSTLGSVSSSRSSWKRRCSPPERSPSRAVSRSPVKPKRSSIELAVISPSAVLGDPPDRLDRVQHPRLRVEVVDVLGQVLQCDGAARAGPCPTVGASSPESRASTEVLPAPFTPTSPTRSPGPSRQVACESRRRSSGPARSRSTSSTSMTSLPSRWVANRWSSSRSRGGGHVLDQRVGRVDAELRLRRPRRRPPAQPGQLLADQVAGDAARWPPPAAAARPARGRKAA